MGSDWKAQWVVDVNRSTKERVAARKRWRAQMQSPGFREPYQAHQREFAYKATWRALCAVQRVVHP